MIGKNQNVAAKLGDRRTRVVTSLAIGIVAVLGLGCKQYRGPGQNWVNNFGPASVCYEVFFVLIVFFVYPRRSAAAKIAVAVCLATCAIEFLQLYQADWLADIRATFIGRTLLGTSFSWWDLPAYPIGAFCGWLLVCWIDDSSSA